jgi:hypothetical protein
VPEVELYDTYTDPYELNNLARDPAYAPLIANLSQQLGQLSDCAGADCRQHPTGQLNFDTGGGGAGSCALSPIVARVFSPNEADITTVDFRVDRALAGSDAEPPFELVLPDKMLRNALPDAAEVVAQANFEDGRRLGLPAKIKICK